MRILAVSDEESKYLYDYYRPGKLDGFDMIISCGDLSVEYLEFLVTLADCPLVYIHGNHDEKHKSVPTGCICADDKLVEVNGVRILGFGGSYKYREGKYMYTENQMKNRIRKKWLSIKRRGGIDILMTHAPARHLNDLETIPHRGFECFNTLLEKYKPRLFVHGHVHRSYNNRIPQKCSHGDTVVVNAFEYCVIDMDFDKDASFNKDT